jgi:lysozyme family protein
MRNIMTASSYDAALARLLVHEGGYTNHPADPSGPTNYGITILDYRKHVKQDATAADVRAMKLDEAKGIYRAKYWDAQRCDELPAGVDYAVFDYGVNSGVGRSGKVLRRVLRLPDSTSVVNDAVIAAARTSNSKALIAAICDERLRFLQSLKTWPVFGAGWGRRVAEVRAAALAMATAVPAAPPPTFPAEQQQQLATSGLFRFLVSIIRVLFKRT